MGGQVAEVKAEELIKKLRRVLYRLRGPEGFYLLQQYEPQINQYLDSGQYDRILNLKVRYDFVEMPMRVLREIAKHYGIKYYAQLTKLELVRAIENATKGSVDLNTH